MLAPDWTWIDAIPVVVTVIILLAVPGYVLGASLGLRGLDRWGAAPLLSTSIVAFGGIAASALSIPWTGFTLVGVTVLVWAAGAGLGRAIQRSPEPVGTLAGMDGAAAVGVGIAFAITAAVVMTASSLPGNFPQHPDTIMHLGITELFIEDRDISSLTAGRFLSPGDPGFYHAALHGVAATAGLLTGAPAAVAMSSTVLVVVGLVWPLGASYLTLRATGLRNRLLAVATPILATAFLSFPWHSLGHGPAWPLAYGNSLVPAAVALALTAFCYGCARPGTAFHRGGLIAVALGLPVLLLAHLSAAITVAVLLWFWAMQVVLEQHAVRRPGWLGHLPLALAGVGTIVALYVGSGFAPEARWEAFDRRGSLRRSLLGSVTWWAEESSTIAYLVGAVLTALAILGIAVVWRARLGRWLVGGWIAWSVVTCVAWAFGSDFTRWVTWPWYSDPTRLRPLVVIFGVPIVAAGVLELRTILERRLSPRHAATTLVVFCLAIAVAQSFAAREWLARYYDGGGGGRTWVSAKELDGLRALSEILPDDAVVAANPWNGANYLALVGPERMLIPWDQSRGALLALLGEHLDEAAKSREVCRAIEDLGVTHVIVGGDPFVALHGDTYDYFTDYAGIDAVVDADGFILVATADPYRLYAIASCED